MRVIKDMNVVEKLWFTALGWHYGCCLKPLGLRLILYPLGIVAIPLGAALFPFYMVWPDGVAVPTRFYLTW